nr:MAG TPA: hypothetical protein [Caudoviricetes sp.]
MWSNVIRYKDSYFSISIYSTPIIFVCGFLLITSISRFFIFLVFQRNPKNRLYCTVAATKMLSRFTNVPVNSPSGVVHPFNENHGSEISTHFRTIVVVSPGKYTMLSRTVPRNLVIVSICAVVTASNSRFFVCNVFVRNTLVRSTFVRNSLGALRACFHSERTHRYPERYAPSRPEYNKIYELHLPNPRPTESACGHDAFVRSGSAALHVPPILQAAASPCFFFK